MKPIFNANSLTLDKITGSLPNVSGALLDWFQPITFILIKKTTVNFKLVEERSNYTFMGVVESQTAQQLQMKPEGQRSWNYINVWALPNVALKVDEVFCYQEKEYRVLRKNDWSQYGYAEFECVEDYKR